MAGTPRVSIVIPSYDKAEFLVECLGSVQQQTFKNWECVIVSDGSARVGEIRKAVAAMRDERFRLVEHAENRGLAAARNTGIREARADLVICVDEDDRLSPECLDLELHAMEKCGAELVVSRVRYFGGRKGEYPVRLVALEEILYNQSLLGCGFLMTKRLWDSIGGWDEHPVLKLGREDHDWWIRVIESGAKIAFVDDVLYEYRTPLQREDREASLNCAAMLNEVKIRHYILQKHAHLYRRFPESRREYLRVGYLREGNSLQSAGQVMRALMRYWQAFFASGQLKDCKNAVRKTIDLMLGKRAI